MSRESLTRAYRLGVISRRDFIRGMVSLGATITVASQLADIASAAPGEAIPVADDVYGNDGASGGDDNVSGNGGSGGGGNGAGSGEGDGDDDAAGGAVGGVSDVDAEAAELANVTQLPATGSGDRDAKSSRTKLYGIGSALAAATAFGIRRFNRQDALTEHWDGWNAGDERSGEREPRALPEGQR